MEQSSVKMAWGRVSFFGTHARQHTFLPSPKSQVKDGTSTNEDLKKRIAQRFAGEKNDTLKTIAPFSDNK
jgi:hypothetical protein